MMCDFGANEADHPTLFLQIHPCAEDVEISVPQPGMCLINAKTLTAGPGYHVFLCDLLHSLAAHHHIEWEEPEEQVEGDETGYFFQRDATSVRQEMLRWLSAMAAWSSIPWLSNEAGRRSGTPWQRKMRISFW